MRKLKWLFLGILVVGLAVVGTARAATPPDCTTNTINLSLGRTPSKGLDGDTIEFTVTVLVPSGIGACQVQNIKIRFWPPYDPPSDPENPCSDPGDPVVLATGLTLDPGESVDFNSIDDANLSYIIDHADEDVNGVIRAWACARGQSQVGPPSEPAQDQRSTNIQVYHPDIKIEKDPNRSNICEGADTLISWIYTVTNPGDVNLTDVVVTDSDCDPVNYVSGDTGDDGILGTDETWIYECNDIISSELTNTATVTANDVELGSPVEDSNDATVLAEAPSCDDIVGDLSPDCNTSGNLLSVLVSGGTPPYGYSWSVTGHASWTIDGGSDTNEITYTAGAPGTTAVFRVDINDAFDCNTACQVELDCGAPPGDTFCTFTQGFWGNAGGKYDGNDTLALLIDYFAEETSLTIGDGSRSVTLWDANCVIERLPAGGKPGPLPSGFGNVNDYCPENPTNPLKKVLKGKQGRYNNTLMGQVIALTLNMWLDEGLGGFELPEGYFCVQPEEGGCATRWMIPQAILDAGVVTVEDLLELANEILDGGDGGVSISNIYDAVTTINEAFDECGTLIDCPDTETNCDDECDDDFDGDIDCEDSDCPPCV